MAMLTSLTVLESNSSGQQFRRHFSCNVTYMASQVRQKSHHGTDRCSRFRLQFPTDMFSFDIRLGEANVSHLGKWSLVGAVPSRLLPRYRPKSVATSRPLHLDAAPSPHRSVRTTWRRADTRGASKNITSRKSLVMGLKGKNRWMIHS